MSILKTFDITLAFLSCKNPEIAFVHVQPLELLQKFDFIVKNTADSQSLILNDNSPPSANFPGILFGIFLLFASDDIAAEFHRNSRIHTQKGCLYQLNLQCS